MTYIGETHQQRVLNFPPAKMCVGVKSMMAVRLTQYGQYRDAAGNDRLVPRVNGNLANLGIVGNSSNAAVASLTRAGRYLSGTLVVTFSVVAKTAGTSEMTFTADTGAATYVDTFDLEVVECDYKVFTASMWHMVDSRQNIVAVTVVRDTLRSGSETSPGVFILERPGGGFSTAGNAAGNFAPPCTGVYELPDSNVLVEGELNTNSRKVSFELTYMPVPVVTAVVCIIPSGRFDDDSTIDTASFTLPIMGGQGSQRHKVTNSLGTFTGKIFYTVTPIPR